MPNSALTRDQIITLALTQAGNTGLTTLAQDWLNNIVDRLFEDFKWAFAEKSTTGSLTQTVVLPADFGDVWDRHSIVAVNSDSVRLPLEIVSPEDFDLLSDPDLEGTPRIVRINLSAKTFVVYPVPEANEFTYQLRYREKPARISSNVVVPFPNDEILIQSVYVKALQHEDDERYANELAILQNLIGNFLGGFNKSPVKTKQTRLNADRFKTIGSFR